MKYFQQIREITGAVLLFVLFIASNHDFININMGKQILHLLYFESIINDEVVLFDKQIEQIKKVHPLQGTVGYMDNQFGVLKDVRQNIVLALYYYRTQYAMAPVIVEYNNTRHFIIGNFMMDRPSAKLIDRPYKVINDFGNGIFLIERQPL